MKTRGIFVAMVTCWTVAAAAQTTQGDFDSNGVKIHYATAGKGEAVVLIHGWMSDSTMWGRGASGNTQLSTAGMDGFQIIAMDCRGHGKSDKPHEIDKYGTEMAEDVVRLLDHLKIQRAHLVGYSMGAHIVGKVAATHPDRVISTIYGGQAPIIAGSAPTGSNEVEVFAKAVEAGKGLGPYLLEVWPPDRPKITLDQANAIAKLLYTGKDVQAFAAAGRSLGALRVTPEDLSKCKAPALFVYGANESQAVKDSVEAGRKVLTSAQVKVIEGADHMTTLANPAFGVAIVEFLHASKSK